MKELRKFYKLHAKILPFYHYVTLAATYTARGLIYPRGSDGRMEKIIKDSVEIDGNLIWGRDFF